MDRSTILKPMTEYPEAMSAHADILMADFDRASLHFQKYGSISKWILIDLHQSYKQLRRKILHQEQTKEAVWKNLAEGVHKNDETEKQLSNDSITSQVHAVKENGLQENIIGQGQKAAESEDQPVVSNSQMLSSEEKELFGHFVQDEKRDQASDMPCHFFDEKTGSRSHRSNLIPSGSTVKYSEPKFPILSYWIPQDQVEHTKTLKDNFEAVQNYVRSCPNATIPSYFHELLYQSYMKLSDKLLDSSADNSQAETDVPTTDTFSTRTRVDSQPPVDTRENIEPTLEVPPDVESCSSISQPSLSKVIIPSKDDLGIAREQEVQFMLGRHNMIQTQDSRDSSPATKNSTRPTSPTVKLMTEPVNPNASVSSGSPHSLMESSEKYSEGFGVEVQNAHTFPMETSKEKAFAIRQIIAANAGHIKSLNSIKNIKEIRWMKKDSCEREISAFVIKFATAKQANEVLWSGLKCRNQLYTCRKFPPTLIKIRQCTTCQIYGHVSSDCKLSPICALCAAPHPTRGCEIKTRKCVLCGGAHAASSDLCQKRISYKNSLTFWPDGSKDKPLAEKSTIRHKARLKRLPVPSVMNPAEALDKPHSSSQASQPTQGSTEPNNSESLLRQIEALKSAILVHTSHTPIPSSVNEPKTPSSFAQPKESDQGIESQSTLKSSAHQQPAILDSSDSHPSDFW